MKNFKWILVFFLFVAILFPILFTLYELGYFSPAPKVDIKNNVPTDAPVLRVVADYDFCPYTFFDENNETTGLDVELMNEIGNRLGRKIELTIATWPTCKTLLQSGEAELILGLEIFSNMQGVLKTIPVSTDELMIFGKDKIFDIGALNGKRVAIVANNVIDKIYDLNCEYVSYFTNTDILEAINKGEVDYGICHASVAKMIIEKSGFAIYPSVALMYSYPGIGVRDDLPELREKLNSVIADMSREEVIKRLDEKWIDDFTNKNTLRDVLTVNSRFYIIYFFSFVIVLLFFIFIYDKEKEAEKDLAISLEYQKNLQKQYNLLSSISEVYTTMHIVDLENNSVVELKSSDRIKELIHLKDNSIEQMAYAIQNTVVHSDREKAIEFTNLETLSERMKGKKSMIAEFRGVKNGWFTAQFIAVDYDKDDNLSTVVFTTQNINAMKLEQERLLKLSSRDELTGLFNRHAFERQVSEIRQNETKDYSIAVFDVNGLKQTNDNLGHSAGDELIKGSAECIQRGFGDIGNCYRTGGDEFTVIVLGKIENKEDAIENFREIVDFWHGDFVDRMAISVGVADSSELNNQAEDVFETILKMADKRMYSDKISYYNKNGIDRRAQSEAFTAICASYTKILKINLKEDSYQIIKTIESEKDESQGFSDKLSDWLTKFAKSGAVFEADLENYLEKTNIDYIKNYFKEHDKEFVLRYRRKINNSFCNVVMEIMPSVNYSEEKQEFYLYVKTF